jgi:hypothetical protein
VLTASAIIEANPEYSLTPRKIGHHNGLVGTDQSGREVWLIYKGDFFVMADGPWDDIRRASAERNLDAIQPGREFATIGDDNHAKAMRKLGLLVERDSDGLPSVSSFSPIRR